MYTFYREDCLTLIDVGDYNYRLFQKQPLEVFLWKGVLKMCSKFTGEHPRRSVISIKFQSNFIEITLWHGYSPVNLLHIFRTPFPKDTSASVVRKYLFSANLFNIETGHLHCKLTCWLLCEGIFLEKFFRTDYAIYFYVH